MRSTVRVGGVALAFVLLGALALGACGSDDSSEGSSSVTANDLDGHTYESTAVDGAELVDGSTIVVTFADGQIAISAGCNQMVGGFDIDGGTLALTSPLASTQMACEQALMDQDAWVAEFFDGDVDVALDGEVLTLSNADITITLAQGTGGGGELVGPVWTLDTIVTGDAASSLPVGVDPPTIEIADDGRVTVFAGCNRGSTTVTVTDDTLTFAPMALTRMACEQAAMDVELAVTTVLDGEVDYELTNQQLRITNGDRGLRFSAG